MAGGWNVGKEMSENYEYFTYIVIAPLYRYENEESLVKWLASNPIGENVIYRELLGSSLIRHLFSETEPTTLVLKAHLYLEQFLDEIIINKFKNGDYLLKNNQLSIPNKADILFAKNYLDKNIVSDISLINKLRNRLAHRLHFDISSYDMSNFSYCGSLDINHFKARSTRTSVNIFIFRHVVYHILLRLTRKYPFIADIAAPAVPESYKSAANYNVDLLAFGAEIAEFIDAIRSFQEIKFFEARPAKLFRRKGVEIFCELENYGFHSGVGSDFCGALWALFKKMPSPSNKKLEALIGQLKGLAQPWNPVAGVLPLFEKTLTYLIWWDGSEGRLEDIIFVNVDSELEKSDALASALIIGAEKLNLRALKRDSRIDEYAMWVEEMNGTRWIGEVKIAEMRTEVTSLEKIVKSKKPRY